MSFPAATLLTPRARLRRALPWAALLLLLGVAQSLLVLLTVRHEAARLQDESESVAVNAADRLRRELLGTMQAVQALGLDLPPATADAADTVAAQRWRTEAVALLRQRPFIGRLERRGADLGVQAALDSPIQPPLFVQLPRSALALQAELACSAAARTEAPVFSRSHFVPLGRGRGLEVLELCVPLRQGVQGTGFLVATIGLGPLLEASTANVSRHEISLVEGDGTRAVRAGRARGAGHYPAERVVDVPGSTLQLRADSVAGAPSLIPNLATALVLGLSLALFGVALLLVRDARRRSRAEAALAESLAFRKAMEDSLVTGLRARDLQGAITYVNPAFCAMVGFAAEELRGPVPPYWPPEHVQDYLERQRLLREHRTTTAVREGRESREGFETVFMRHNGERFPVMIYEAPLVDGQGRHTGYMSAVLDVTAQRRVEDLSRQSQERLQATARLATVGEMASLLSHELNQPLTAIASYASGSLNMLDASGDGPDAETQAMLRQVLGRIVEQADRAGRVIKSVNHFVRRREQQHESLGVDVLLDAVLPLVRLQARKSGTRVEVDVVPAGTGEDGTPRPPRVRCDRTMIEQVLLNLTRNAIQAMETGATPLAARVLRLQVRQTHGRWVSFEVVDAGPGIEPEVAARLFTPFFTTRSEGMGLGLSLCRTVVEQHGGALDHGPGPWRADGLPRGTAFRFTLPAAPGALTPPAVALDPSEPATEAATGTAAKAATEAANTSSAQRGQSTPSAN